MGTASIQNRGQLAAGDRIRSVTVVGGGAAGLAAACALADSGYHVDLLERRGYVGGRASSYEHPGTAEVIDNCQHILVGCCTNLIDLYRRIGVENKIRWFDRITFVEPGGMRSVLEPSWLPAPLHTSLAFLRAHAFSLADKLAISRGLMAFLRGIPEDSEKSFADWLVENRQTKGAIERFWRPALISALNEDADRISVHYAGMVIREMFLRSPEAGRMGVPTIPLSDLYGRAMEYIRVRGGQVHLRTNVESLTWNGDRHFWELRTGEPAQSFTSDAVVLALSFEAMAKLLPRMPQMPGVDGLAARLSQFDHSPITSIHLWFDREITDLDHAALLDSRIDWMYHTSRLQPQRKTADGSYVELVCSASRQLTNQSREEILAMAIEELGRFFPRVREAVLRKAAVVKEVRATYSIRPMLDPIRPGQGSPWPNAFLAGDWTATGWPATMEGAVRSGYLAAEALTLADGAPRKILQPDLASTGLMRLFDEA
ncbi:MAG TPA: hydroxysqualene dehydroxylase HpnE [Acidisarcina sp.]|nr:hydroxysqualene dehydroxylase HpnE [Acidisarcina sp.]